MSTAPLAQADRRRIALVTGGVRGIGLACARELAGRGDEVWIGWRSSTERAAALRAEFGERLLRADLAREEQAAGLAAELERRRGGLDVWVHAVGDFESGPLEATDAAALQRLFDSNVSSFHTAWRALAPLLRARRGRVLAFACPGLAGLRPRRQAAAYAAVKSALCVLVRSLAVEEAARGVTLHLLSPGVVPHDAAHPDTLATELQQAIPQGRVATPEEIARCAAWLVSDEARHATGGELVVSGAWQL
ncbi:MAG: SDR family oxidoreductase [Planctomycetes bacterium]|nr:SDR family oxidoreductase [Planctomycetota bacterium]